jgi:hypothetical protein
VTDARLLPASVRALDVVLRTRRAARKLLAAKPGAWGWTRLRLWLADDWRMATEHAGDNGAVVQLAPIGTLVDAELRDYLDDARATAIRSMEDDHLIDLVDRGVIVRVRDTAHQETYAPAACTTIVDAFAATLAAEKLASSPAAPRVRPPLPSGVYLRMSPQELDLAQGR